jgi:predicted dehydrogenase/threonine dehydrogenase-like Zn-dependent dehydrogenase
MKQVLVKGGGVVVTEVPAPMVGAKEILVRVHHSCVSPGTEMAGVKNSGLPLYRRALQQPHHAKRVLGVMREQGIKRTFQRVQGMLSAGLPTGYSAAGTILEVGDSVTYFSPGDQVACAGAGCANHAEIISVPVNLAVKLPEGLQSDLGSTVTLGAIALQGVRRASPTLGETIVVVGLGVLGQLTAQMLSINGCRVIGVDIDADRLALAVENGMDWAINPAKEDYVSRVAQLTSGFGADAVIVTAASSSNSIIGDAMRACRKKGRVVLVGSVGLDLKREDMYKKELDFFISTSYGPGRYDSVYEEGGQDYPLPYVRWTENRNMEAYLALLASGQLAINKMLTDPVDIDQATAAYESLASPDGQPRPLMVLLSYPGEHEEPIRRIAIRRGLEKPGRIRVGIAGAGGFIQGMHLPNFVKLRKQFEIRAIMSRTGSNARAVATQYQAAYATTAYDELLTDPDIDLVMIGTRHDMHAEMVLKCLEAGKNVFVEKPLAITKEEIDSIEAFFEGNASPPMLMTGFNRRFSPGIQRIASALAQRTTPLIVNYRMNAGFLGLDHWVHGPEGGGRNIGEACHIYDLFNFLTGAEVASVSAHAIRPPSRQWTTNDNFVATISFRDGSVCTLTYTALGSKSHPKEQMEVFADGKVLSLNNYQSVSIRGSKEKGWKSVSAQKGQLEELDAVAECLGKGGAWPISLEQQIQATETAQAVEALIKG